MNVAKTYQNWIRISDEFQENGRWYVQVRSPAGAERKVRAYTDREYQRMYPGEVIIKESTITSQKKALGFEKDYIWIFKGDIYPYEDWFRRSIARYCRWWGWYIVSTDELPADIPCGITPIQLPWDAVGKQDGNLIPENQIENAVAPYLYEESTSEFQGSIGDRIELNITVTKNIKVSGSFGESNMHIMEDENSNVYVWTTAAKDWAVGSSKRIKANIKDYRIYKGVKQNILTRAMEIK